MIHFQNITKTYRDSRSSIDALKDVDLDVEKGEFLAVRGPSGCGKSTLLMISGALCRPTSGIVQVAGEDLASMSVAHRARFRAQRIGFVFQMFHLLPYLNILDNVTYAASFGRHSEARIRALELLEEFKLDARAHHRPADLSAGERQRVAVARALINRPELLLADEPTGNLDPESADTVLQLLSDFHASGGTVLLVTHDEAAAQYAQRTLRLRNGTIEG
ncbi:MAG: ABC transporter ATP-binding protein [Pirellulales bacterium]|nr:ABC transporter ATP-binding protein [Pirellulales bacterium]